LLFKPTGFFHSSSCFLTFKAIGYLSKEKVKIKNYLLNVKTTAIGMKKAVRVRDGHEIYSILFTANVRFSNNIHQQSRSC
jgi:glutaredoxin-related protein